MIPLIPYQRWEMTTPLSLYEAVNRLSVNVTDTTWLLWPQRNSPAFAGKVSVDGFEIRRVIRYRNFSLPVLRGRFVSDQDRLRVELVASLDPLALAFFAIMAVVLFSYGTTPTYAGGGSHIGPLPFLGGLYPLLMGSFIYELQRAKNLFEEIFPRKIFPKLGI